MALVISETDVQELISPEMAYQAVRNAHLALASGSAANVVRSRAKLAPFMLHTLSAVENDHAAAKIYTSAPRMVASHVLLYDRASGALVAMMGAAELGRLRTAAAMAMAADLLFPVTQGPVGIFGSGFQAEGLISAFSSIGAKRFICFSRSTEKLGEFARRCASKYRAEVIEAKSAEALVWECPVIITSTTANEPVFDAKWVSGSKFIGALGANSLIRREIPPQIVAAAALVVVDDIEVARVEGGNLLPAIESGRLQWNQVKTVGELLASTERGRSSGHARQPHVEGVTVFCSHGLGVQDLFLAKAVFFAAKTAGKGVELPL